MNLLLMLFRDHRKLVDQLADAERVSLPDVLDADAAPRRPFGLDRELLDAIAADGPLGPLLTEGYLRGIATEEWREHAAGADVLDPFDLPEWVTFVQGTRGRGLCVPNDGQTSTRVSVFTPVDGKVRRASIEYQRTDRPWGLSISAQQECSLPDWGRCPPGECGGGDCQHLRSSDGDRMICWCGDSLSVGRRLRGRFPRLRW